MIILRKSAVQEENGFTLLEVLVAVFLLVAVLTPIVAYFGKNLNKVAEVRSASVALNLAKEGMEKVRNGEFSECPDSYDKPVDESTWQITYQCSDLGTFLIKVTVKVFKGSSTDHLVELVTIIESPE